ncbi:hypothetical protein GCM10022419_033280 [Nonomuraea rosea]|uniref:Uncharacterized protein n=1 Tax=Nonomuraea rosea TaxID=638574 RepID=A0ABP6WDS1_9ACTN
MSIRRAIMGGVVSLDRPGLRLVGGASAREVADIHRTSGDAHLSERRLIHSLVSPLGVNALERFGHHLRNRLHVTV